MKKVCSYVWHSPVILFLLTLGLVMGLGALAIRSPGFAESASGFFRVLGFCLTAFLILFTIVGMLDCLGSENEAHVKLLWVIIMLIAPILGPLLWFACGRGRRPPAEKRANEGNWG